MVNSLAPVSQNVTHRSSRKIKKKLIDVLVYQFAIPQETLP